MSGGALVVGGSRGIGRASAIELARQGFHPIVLGYVADREAAEAARAAITALGVEARLLQADVSDETGIEAMVAALDDLGEPARAVVYSAGHRVLGPTMEQDASAWQRALDVTLTGFVRTVQATSTRLGAGAKVVGISGISGLRAYSDQHLAMGTAKAASHHAMTYLAWELAGRGINLNMVCCGAVETEGVHRDLTPEQYEHFVALARSRIPRGRIAHVDEVARLVAALCSPAADLLVGQVIVADGGELLR